MIISPSKISHSQGRREKSSKSRQLASSVHLHVNSDPFLSLFSCTDNNMSSMNTLTINHRIYTTFYSLVYSFFYFKEQIEEQKTGFRMLLPSSI
uniref:Uncharacterized protein n=1 Tax=Amphiprion ocellaris TaxID=80972 RepID=A0A3Q1CXR0_AMPOC